MLEAMSKKLCDELRSLGINAVLAYPDGEMDAGTPMVAISLKNAAIGGGGFGDYLGVDDAGEVYGIRCQAKFALDVYSHTEGGYARLSKECDRLISALWALSGGIGALELGECSYDKALCCLKCRGQLGASFWLTQGSETEEITDFTVKGMILHGNE